MKLQDQLPEAIAELKKSLEFNPALVDAHYTLGVTYWQQGNFDEAAEQLRAAIRLKPDYAEAWYTLGTALKQAGKTVDAEAALRQALKYQPDFAGAHTVLASILQQTGKTEEAAAERATALQITRTNTGLQTARFSTNSGTRLLGAGDLDGAIAQFESAIAAAPNFAPAHFQLGVALEKKGNKEAAQAEYRKAAEIDAQFGVGTR